MISLTSHLALLGFVSVNSSFDHVFCTLTIKIYKKITLFNTTLNFLFFSMGLFLVIWIYMWKFMAIWSCTGLYSVFQGLTCIGVNCAARGCLNISSESLRCKFLKYCKIFINLLDIYCKQNYGNTCHKTRGSISSSYIFGMKPGKLVFRLYPWCKLEWGGANYLYLH